MLNKLVISGLTVLTLFIFSSAAYSQYNMALINHYSQLPYSEAYATAHMGTTERSGIMSASYNEGLPGVGKTTYYRSFDDNSERAHAVYSHNVDETSGVPAFVTHRKYVRPSDVEKQEVYLAPMEPPVITQRTSIGVPPYGYKYHTKNTKAPIRDFRTDIWLTKKYTSASEKHILYDEMYGSSYINPDEK